MASKPTDCDAEGILTAEGVLRRLLELNPEAEFINITPEVAEDLLQLIADLRAPSQDYEA